jgi:hypothetical protein
MHGGFEKTSVAHSGIAAVVRDLVCVDGDHFLDR